MSLKEYLKSQLFNRTITFDTNIFILLVVGSIGKEHISLFKRTKEFTVEQYEFLQTLLLQQNQFVISSHVITEASNLLESFSFRKQPIGLIQLKEFINNSVELYSEATQLVQNNSYLKFGLSDASIEELCKKEVVVFTVDLPLYGYLYNQSFEVYNLNHIIEI